MYFISIYGHCVRETLLLFFALPYTKNKMNNFTRRTTRNTTPDAMNNAQDTDSILLDISGKITMLSDNLGALLRTMADISLQFKLQNEHLTKNQAAQSQLHNGILDVGANMDEKLKDIKTVLDTKPQTNSGIAQDFQRVSVADKLDNMSQEISHLANYELLDQVNQLRIDEEAYRKRRQQTKWKHQLNQRKQAFWNSIKTRGIGNLYAQYIDQERVYLPRKFRPQEIRGEPEDQTDERVRLAVESLRAEYRILASKAERHQARYLQIDQDMSDLIHKTANGRVAEKLQNIWIKDCEREEQISLDMWHKKQQWFSKQRELETTKHNGKPPLLNKKPNSNKPTPAKPKNQQNINGPHRPNAEKPTYAQVVKGRYAQKPNVPKHGQQSPTRRQQYRKPQHHNNQQHITHKRNSPNMAPNHTGRQNGQFPRKYGQNKPGQNMKNTWQKGTSNQSRPKPHFLSQTHKFRNLNRNQQRRM